MTQSKKSLWTFSLAFVAFECLCIGVLLSSTRLEQMTWVNSHHALWADYIFRFLTSLAEVFLPIALAVYLYQKKRSFFVPFLTSYAVSTLIIQGIKHLIFPNALRPIAYFAKLHISWDLVPGVDVHTHNSFPSGHTSAAWFMFFWFALLGKSRLWGLFMALIAIGVAYSRLYLMQHFPIDVTFGAGIGFLSSALVYYFMLYKSNENDVKRNA
ncbi:phosphatase PAP2 family protein [Aquirufa sp.]|uniref:phosphatase PAP2 family protein n=1 Tax=Aquirufa sp. TaxID=2676249 RepID=UPI0037BFCD7B